MRYGICEWCGKRFPRKSGVGRPRKYCTNVCTKAYVREVAQPAWEERERRKRIRQAY